MNDDASKVVTTVHLCQGVHIKAPPAFRSHMSNTEGGSTFTLGLAWELSYVDPGAEN
ncbi:unnamed protein product [Sphenostylis stenocarpa]|uniref:Uncharacterized protein n=1 Tax=Sphenostylis stenocarpa TaxID=92480 RepID=A0AA86SW10_9FABA|nr:unnamed protein product [Sphenostylis stenocarpa]